ncbi:MAG: hypothetical protein ABGZ24_28980, partial [Fuerstiella sp.]
VSQEMIADHEAILEAVTAGEWDDAAGLLAHLPDEDGPRQFLIRQMALFGNTPPSDWDGVFSLAGK